MSQELRIDLENKTDIAQAQAVAAFCDDMTVVATFATGESFIVKADGTLTPMTASPAQKPKAAKPKAKATPTKRKESAAQKKFRADILEGKYAKRRANDVWKATKPEYMFGVSYDAALRKGWAKKDGTISKKGEKMTNLTARQVAALYPRRR